MVCEVAFVYKYYPFDPTEHALLRWLKRIVPSAQFFEIPLDSRKNPNGPMDADPRFVEFVRQHRPKQVWVWNNLLFPAEVAECKSVGAKVASLMNSFVVMHGGHFPDQPSYLNHLRNLDVYYVSHGGDVAPLRAMGINAVEMPFFYDPELYRPLPRLLAPRLSKKGSILFIGSVSESAASNRRILIEGISKKAQVHLITFKDPKIKNVVWHRATNWARLLNWWQNRATLILNIEDVGDAYSPEALNARHGTTIVPYHQRLVFHGNHVFPAMGSGRICLSEWSEPLLRFCTPGQDILTWKTPEEAADQAFEIFGRPERLAEMQNAALAKVRSLHTAEIRIREIFQGIASI